MQYIGFHKKTIKNISAAMAAVSLFTMGGNVFAVNNTDTAADSQNYTVQLNENEGETTQETTQNTNVNVNLSINYFSGEDDSYTVNISSLDYLTEYKNFAFVIEATADDAVITNPALGEKLSDGDYGISGKKKITVTNASSDTLQSGKLTLCSFTLTSASAPTAENITISNFTAVGKDGTTVTFTPAVVANEGPVVPELSDKEENVYSLITALPTAESLSFYNDDNSLFDTESLKTAVTEAETAYAALTDTEKANVNAVLDYNMKDKDIITTLKPIVEAMTAVSEIISTAKTFEAIKDEDIINYQFMLNIYNSKINVNVSSEGLPESSQLKTQFDAAVTAMTSKNTLLQEKLGNTDYATKILAVDKQLKTIQTMGDSKYYNDYLNDLLEKANALYTEINESDNSLKVYMCQDLKEKIEAIESVQKAVASTPKVTWPENKRIARGSSYIITVNRDKNASYVAGTVTVKVYATVNSAETQIDEWDFEIEANETSKTGTGRATLSVYPDGDLKIEVSYTVGGVTKVLEEAVIDSYTITEEATGIGGNSGTTVGIGGGSSSSGSGSGGTTKYPTAEELEDDNDDDSDTDTDEVTLLFNDISNYGWAKEAIEGLYYAGIVNGMEEKVFNPAGEVTREQFCKMVVQLFGIYDSQTGTKFNDVDNNAWYAPYIYSAVSAGYIQGQSDDFFGVGQPIMRQDMVTILYRALKNSNNAAVLDFTDNDSIAEYAKDAIAQLVGMGVINGYEDGSFKPRGTATRAEAAKVIWGVFQAIN